MTTVKTSDLVTVLGCAHGMVLWQMSGEWESHWSTVEEFTQRFTTIKYDAVNCGGMTIGPGYVKTGWVKRDNT